MDCACLLNPLGVGVGVGVGVGEGVCEADASGVCVAVLCTAAQEDDVPRTTAANKTAEKIRVLVGTHPSVTANPEGKLGAKLLSAEYGVHCQHPCPRCKFAVYASFCRCWLRVDSGHFHVALDFQIPNSTHIARFR